MPTHHDLAPTLRRLGVSEPLARLAAGDCVPPLLRDRCPGPSCWAARGVPATEGPDWLPLWDRGGMVFGVGARPGGGLAFGRCLVELPDGPEHLAATEQGLWVHCFDLLYESEPPPRALHEDAEAVGFRHLAQHLQARLRAEDEGRIDTCLAHAGWLRAQAAAVDRLSAGADGGRA